MLACGQCRSCREGHPELCARSDEIGFTVDGNWSDYAALPVANLKPLLPELSSPEATMLEALTCQMGALKALDIGFGETVAIVGSGLAALLFVQLARLRGAGYVAVVMREYPERRALARQFGADTVVGENDAGLLCQQAQVQSNDGFDAAIDAVGTEAAARLALHLVRRGGRVLLYGLRAPVINGFPLGEVVFRNLTLYGRTSAPHMWGPAMDLVARGALHLSGLVEMVELEDLPALLTSDRHGGPLKHVVRIRGT
jgi:threonine dehydrogenase-like Zn-dependent dehydrogenase